jgi:hypothetical protein
VLLGVDCRRRKSERPPVGSDSISGNDRENDPVPTPDGVLSAVTEPDGTLKLIGWAVGPAGELTRVRSSSGQPASASRVALCPEPLSGDARMVTATRAETGSGSLRLVTWRD